MADEDREFKIRITGDASGIVAASGQSEKALEKVSEKTKEGGKAAEHSEINHRALHMAFRQVGESSKGLEIGLTALSGVMMGSSMFGIMALGEGVRMLTEHFQKVKDAALEQAHIMTTMWLAGLDQASDARQAVADYAETLGKMASSHNTLNEKQAEGEALLKNELKLRKELLETMMQTELAQAKGDQGEQERIRQRYGHQKQETDLQDQMIELLHQRRELDERGAETETKRAAADEAGRQKTSMGSAFRGEAAVAEKWIADHRKELDEAEAARKNVQALQEEVTRRAAEPSYMVGLSGPQETAAGAARRRLEEAEKAEAAYSALQQEWEHNRDTVETYKEAVKRVDKNIAETSRALTEADATQEAARAEVHKLEALYQQNRDALRNRQEVEAIPIIKRAGAEPSPAAQGVMRDIWALMGTGQGERMGAGETSSVNALLGVIAAAQHSRGQTDSMIQTFVRQLIAEIKDQNVSLDRKFNDVWQAMRTLRAQHRDTYNQ